MTMSSLSARAQGEATATLLALHAMHHKILIRRKISNAPVRLKNGVESTQLMVSIYKPEIVNNF
ncbi:hypothetical protein MNBD_ALPHA05-1573 [hydrothermal vent metagenome]|uniref:Uncharacterized protein n=1 Tax=hydrothermal vent metagenome TaxID=652676 RepID=A0A3B0SNE1_9ZZZZ